MSLWNNMDIRGLSYLFVVTLMVVLTGCSTAGPEFKQPVWQPAQGGYFSADQEGQAGSTARVRPSILPAVQHEWWTQFGSRQLNQWVAQALAHNHHLDEAIEHVRAAQALLKAEGGDQLPRVDAELAAGRSRYGAEFLGPLPKPPAFNYFALGLNIQYDLDLKGGIKRALEQQGAQVATEQQRLAAAQLDLAGSVVRLSIRLAQLGDTRHDLVLMKSLIRKKKSMLEQAKEAGGIADHPLDQIQEDEQDIAIQIAKVQMQMDQTRADLAVLLGEAPSLLKRQTISLTDLHIPLTLPLSVPSMLLEQRPDIQIASDQLHAATAAVGIAEARLYPSVVLTAQMGPQATDPAHLFEMASNSWGFGASLIEPILNRARLKGAHQAAQYQLKASWDAYHQTVIESFAQVSRVLAAIQHDHIEQNERTQQDSLILAEVERQKKAYLAGGGTSLDVLQANLKSVQEHAWLLDDRTEYLHDCVDFYMAMGIL